MIPDKFFTWPWAGSLWPAIKLMVPVFEGFRWPLAVSSPAGSLIEHIAYQCRQHNISPQWLMVSGQREQSSFRGADPAVNYQASAMAAWLGFVGQDQGRAVLPGYYGLFQQVNRLCEQSAWLLGVEPVQHWPGYLAASKTVKRYRPGVAMLIEKDGTQAPYTPLSAGEYLQLSYTPHAAVLKTNEDIARQMGFFAP